MRYISNTTSLNGAFPKDVKPGPYPSTPEERAKAAKRYGMR